MLAPGPSRGQGGQARAVRRRRHFTTIGFRRLRDPRPVRQGETVDYPTVARLDINEVLNAIASVGAAPVVPVRPLSGGAVGAWAVRRPNGETSVLTWRGPRRGEDEVASAQRITELVTIARAHGIPAPRYEDVVALPDGGVVILQEFVAGMRPASGRQVVASLLELSERRRSVLSGTGYEKEGTALYLRQDGPGFCLHGPLRDHDRRTRRLLEWIEDVGSATDDVVVGTDLVHFDYHLGNVLVSADDASEVVAIVDWDGAGNGDVALDGVILALDLVLYNAEPAVVDQIVDHLSATTPLLDLRSYWAHGLLRLVDWRLRHSPQDDLAWLPRAEQLAGV